MNSVIDANVFKYFWEKFLEEGDEEINKNAFKVFERLENLIAYIDVGCKIETEWKNRVKKVDRYLFDVWLSEEIRDNKIQLIEIQSIPHLRKKLCNDFGFPKDDVKYVLTAKAALHRESTRIVNGERRIKILIISEDIDFYAPKEKNSRRDVRKDFILPGRGPVVQYLKKKEGVLVVCTITYLANY